MTSDEKVVAHFREQYGTTPEYLVRAPGRINLIGEHTDYNQGWVLPAAIDKAIYFAVKRNDSKVCNLTALDLKQAEKVSLPVGPLEGPLWVQYVQGACKVLADKGHEVKGFDCVFGGDIPIGAGLSSSAALDCGCIKAISLLNELNLTDWDIVEVSNLSNNHWIGIQSGILDQFASIFGKTGTCMALDCRSRTYERHAVDFGAFELILIDTHVEHQHTSSGYNDLPALCKEAVVSIRSQGVEIDSLRDLSMDMLMDVQQFIDQALYSRAQFIVEENARVGAFVEALKQQDISSLGQLLYASHQGLQHLYQVSCLELDLLVDLTREESAVAGARMMGGGFGGCTLNLVRSTEVERVVHDITTAYKENTSIDASVYQVKISDGVEILKTNVDIY